MSQFFSTRSRARRAMTGLAATCFAALGGCVSSPSAEDPPAHETRMRPGVAAAYDCEDGSAFILHFDDDSGRLARPPDDRLLRREVSASGVKYVAEGLLVWTKGDEALIEIDGRRHQGCRENRARSAWEQARIGGVDFRGLGNEPGWILDIDEEAGVTFVTDYGQTLHRFDRPDRHESRQQGVIRYNAPGDDGEIVITLTPGGCLDDMSGEPFPVRAEVSLAARNYRGCGRMLRDPPSY